VLFGGGTRITMELGEYRESVDIDFLCPDIQSYRAVRTQMRVRSLGTLIHEPFDFARDILVDRYGVRTVIKLNGTGIKLAFLNCSAHRLKSTEHSPFPVPSIDRQSCYITKVLAHTDRSATQHSTDFIDLLMMYRHWGGARAIRVE